MERLRTMPTEDRLAQLESDASTGRAPNTRPCTASPAGNLTVTDSHQGLELRGAAATALRCSRFVARALTAELAAAAETQALAWLEANAQRPWDRERIESHLAADRQATAVADPDAWVRPAV